MTAIITATGLWTPSESVSNDELVTSYNAYADLWNAQHADKIAAGDAEAVPHSSSAFIEKALRNAGRAPSEVDAIIIACSNIQRAYPAISIEVQNALRTSGFAFDMNVACSSSTFGIETARGFIASGQAKSVLVINPEICTDHMNYKNRDSHFIFGDVATAVLVEDESRLTNTGKNKGWDILGSKLITKFSNNIRNNFGFLNRWQDHPSDKAPANPPRLRDKLFAQNGRSVFKEVVPMVAALISDDFKSGDHGLICSFGAGYSAGLIVMRKR